MVHSNREACWCFHSGDSVIIPSGWACVTVTRVWLSYRSSIILITLLFFFNFTLISFVDFENRERKETWQRKKSLTVAVKWLGLWCNHSGWWCFLYVHTKTLVLCTHFVAFYYLYLSCGRGSVPHIAFWRKIYRCCFLWFYWDCLMFLRRIKTFINALLKRTFPSWLLHYKTLL